MSETIRSPNCLASSENAFSTKNLLRIQPVATELAALASREIVSTRTEPVIRNLYASPPSLLGRVGILTQ